MKYKSLIIILFSLIVIIALVLIFSKNIENDENHSIIKISACPTFYQFLKKLNNNDNYFIIPTSSTSESLEMLENEEVDYAVGGRILMPGEANFSVVTIGEGFSFLSDKNLVVYDYNLSSYKLYTDLDLDLLRDNFGDLNYEIVDNVYDYLENNIVITSWENTDFNQAAIIHILKADNSRNIKSRLPTVFCKKICNDDIIKNIKNIINL